MKAKFSERLGAWIIDMIIVGFITSIISTALPLTNNELEGKIDKLEDQVVNKEITTEKFFDEYKNIQYENQKNSMLETGISLVITLGYFVIFQYLNKGQTVGKKLLNIRVVDEKTNEPATIIKGLIRSLITLGIASSTLNLILINLLNKNIFVPLYLIITVIESLFILVTAIMMANKENGKGLHDMMANTKVIKEEGRW